MYLDNCELGCYDAIEPIILKFSSIQRIHLHGRYQLLLRRQNDDYLLA